MRNTSNEQPLDLIVKYARHYVHGPDKEYDHLFYFSKNISECESLLIFGGHVYRQRNGYTWFLGNRKSLIALCKLLESREDLNDELGGFVERMKEHETMV